MTTSTVYVCVHVRWRKETGHALVDRVDAAFKAVARRFPEVKVGTSDASVDVDGSWRETLWLELSEAAPVELVCQAVVKEIGSIDPQEGATPVLEIRLNGQDESTIFRKPLDGDLHTGWTLAGPRSPGGSLKEEIGAFPERIAYLRPLAIHYQGVGGDDVYCLFESEARLKYILEELSPEAAAELRAVYERIASQGDDVWIADWACSESQVEDREEWAVAVEFLAFLDRLVEGGLFGPDDGAKRKTLVDWDRLG